MRCPKIGMKRAQMVAAGVVLPPRAMAGLASLDTNGVTTFPLGVNGEAFVAQMVTPTIHEQ